MGYFEACANPVRTDATGRRVIVPFRWFGPVYLLRDDAEVARVRRGFKWLQIVSFAFIVVATGKLQFRVIIPLLVAQPLWIYLLTRGLSRADITAADMPRVPRGEAIARSNAAMGRPLVLAIRMLFPVMSLLFFWGAWEFRGIEAWICTPVVLALNVMLVYDFLQERKYRNSQTLIRST